MPIGAIWWEPGEYPSREADSPVPAFKPKRDRRKQAKARKVAKRCR